ncbi:MAG: YqgE/AlgH family protein [Acidobacteria bacterium]|nr:YqgE/AlgH family protein [Acidobacteriota bacterium]
MSQVPSGLEAPTLLIAMPRVLDPYFHRSVILLLHHQEEGSVGFIVNKVTEIRVAEILQGMDVGWGGPSGACAFYGGPVQPQLGSVLYGAPAFGLDELEGVEFMPGMAVTQHVGDLEILATDPPPLFRFLLGYAGWGEGQLVEEILRDDWLLAPVREDLVFGDDPATMWERALRSVGVDPAALPSWTPGSGADDAN